MIEKILYLEKDGKAIVYRCFGTGSHVSLPARIGALQVTGIGDHCFAPEMSVRVNRDQLKAAYRFQWEGAPDACSRGSGMEADRTAPGAGADSACALCGDALQEIDLPESLRFAGDYCFYGCSGLEKLYFPAGFTRLAGGCFVDAHRISNICFELPVPEGGSVPALEYGQIHEKPTEILPENLTPPCLKDVLSEVIHEFRADVLLPGGKCLYRLYFPGYYETGEENTPARIIVIKYEGMGYKYRQCFIGRRLDFRQYDSLLYEASLQELTPTVLRIAFIRLMHPLKLDEDARENYVRYLRQNYRDAAAWILEEGRFDELAMLCRLQPGYFTEEILDYYLEEAGRRKVPEAVSLLMEYRRRHFKVQRKRYTF